MTNSKNKSQKKKRTSAITVSEIGRLGGQSTARKYGKDHMRKLGKKGALSRWGKSKKTTSGS